MVISNGSDLALPIKQARVRVSVGTGILVPNSLSMRSVAALAMELEDAGGGSWSSLTA